MLGLKTTVMHAETLFKLFKFPCNCDLCPKLSVAFKIYIKSALILYIYIYMI